MKGIVRKAATGERLTKEEGVELFKSYDLVVLGKGAEAVSHRLHPEPYRTYNIDRNINYTNICSVGCDFCAFHRTLGSEGAYVLPRHVLLEKVREAVALGGNQILLQGGLHPTLPFSWYEGLLRDIKRRFPAVNVHGFSPPEVNHFAAASSLPVRGVLERLREAGLGSIPGGGAEILVDAVRRQISPRKVRAEDWLNVMREWHELGGRSSATMMFGHVETVSQRIEHLDRLRQLQDETGGFTAFICWPFQPASTAMPRVSRASAFEYLRTQAIARLYLDNFANIQASWVTQGLRIGQLAMLFGANDMGSLMIEENVVSEAGTSHTVTLAGIRRAIEELGYLPRQRNVYYQLVDQEQEKRAIEAERQRRSALASENQ
ncbi:MAG: cyclic dehypoxanthinyl futalosine synthase [Planctomycetota bacterium]